MLMSRITKRCFSSSKNTIGFIGLGQMGIGMASNLVKKGHTVLGFDVFSDSMQKAEAAGIQIASGDEEIAQKCSTIITMLRTREQILAVYGSMFQHVQPGTLFIDSSTVDPATSQELTQQAISKGCEAVDAPVSGGVPKAASGELTFMVGGSKAAYDRSTEFLDKMGATTYHCGEKPGSGQVVKICNNLILGISMNAVSEGMSLGVKLGMDPEVLTKIISASTGNCWSINTYTPVPGVKTGIPSSNDYNGGFAVDLMVKDLNLAEEAADSVGQKLDFGEVAKNVYNEISDAGFGGKDFSIAYQRASGTLPCKSL